MGLDMYLIKRKKTEAIDGGWGDNDSVYWRKANQIHRWFVENIQDGEDDCDFYEVPKAKILDLLFRCEEVLNKSTIKTGSIKNGIQYVDGKPQPTFEIGRYIEDTNIADKFLPTYSGFFYGSTDYNEYYLQQLEDTIKDLKTLLQNFDEVDEYLVYTSSW